MTSPTNPAMTDEIERVARVADKIADAIAEQAQPVMQLEDANAIDKAVAELTRLREQIAAKDEALTPSAKTKAAYSGEFRIEVPDGHDPLTGDELYRWVDVPWTTIKEIMEAIRNRAKPIGGEE